MSHRPAVISSAAVGSAAAAVHRWSRRRASSAAARRVWATTAVPHLLELHRPRRDRRSAAAPSPAVELARPTLSRA